MILTTSK